MELLSIVVGADDKIKGRVQDTGRVANGEGQRGKEKQDMEVEEKVALPWGVEKKKEPTALGVGG